MSFIRITRYKMGFFAIVSMLLMAFPLIAYASNDEESVITTIVGPSLLGIGFPEEDLAAAGLALDRKTGDLYITSFDRDRVLMREADTGILSLVAGTGVRTGSIDGEGGDPSDDLGDGGSAKDATLNRPRAVAFTRGILFIAEPGNRRVRVVNLTGDTVEVAGVEIEDGNIGTIAGTGSPVWVDGPPLAAIDVGLPFPDGLAIDAEGNLFISDPGMDRVLFMNLQKKPIPIPGQSGTLDPGHVVSVVGTGVRTGSIDGEGGDPSDDLGDGGPVQDASFFRVINADLPPDGEHLLFLADRDNHRVRVANLTGHTVKVAGVKIKAGEIDTVAGNADRGYAGEGGPATTASLVGPTDVSVDGDGNIFITDSQDILGADFAQPRILRVDGKTGIITTIAGNGVVTGSIDGEVEGGDPSDDLGDGGPPILATFSSFNFNILLDKEDRLLISDYRGSGVRRVDPVDDDDDD